ncbi:MAG: hypothetical protein AAF492_12120, partial [Verrucomicrobiota bacterium]
TVNWTSETGKMYNLWRSTNLVTDPGTIIMPNVPATPPVNTYIDPVNNLDRAFYYIEVQQ